MKIRPKGSNQPFRPADSEEDGRYALRHRVKGAMTGRTMELLVWYKPSEVDVEQ